MWGHTQEPEGPGASVSWRLTRQGRRCRESKGMTMRGGLSPEGLLEEGVRMAQEDAGGRDRTGTVMGGRSLRRRDGMVKGRAGTKENSVWGREGGPVPGRRRARREWRGPGSVRLCPLRNGTGGLGGLVRVGPAPQAAQ